MPGFSGGTTVSSSAQLGADVVLSSKIKDGEIVAADLSATAAIAGSQLDANAGIVDTQLGTISTAGKVSGAALTLLPNIPSGAGLIPTANLPAPASANGIFQHTENVTTTTTIAHGLGKTPSIVTFFDFGENQCIFSGVYSGGAGHGLWMHVGTTTPAEYAYAIACISNGANGVVGTVSVDATNITITWANLGTPGGQVDHILWNAQ